MEQYRDDVFTFIGTKNDPMLGCDVWTMKRPNIGKKSTWTMLRKILFFPNDGTVIFPEDETSNYPKFGTKFVFPLMGCKNV